MTKFIAQIHWFIIIILIQLARLGSSLRAYNHISNSKVSKESILILAKINALQPNEAVGEVLLLILHILWIMQNTILHLVLKKKKKKKSSTKGAATVKIWNLFH